MTCRVCASECFTPVLQDPYPENMDLVNTVTPENFEVQKVILKQLIEGNPSSQGALPPLVVETSAWDDFLHKIGEWFVHLLKDLSFSVGSNVGDAVRLTVYVLLGILVLFLIYKIVKSVGPQKESVQRENFLVESLRIPFAIRLQKELDEALQKGQWSLAGRLRWKLFLYRTKKSETATPLEVFGREQTEASLSFYRLMFGEASILSHYKNCDEALKKWET